MATNAKAVSFGVGRKEDGAVFLRAQRFSILETQRRLAGTGDGGEGGGDIPSVSSCFSNHENKVIVSARVLSLVACLHEAGTPATAPGRPVVHEKREKRCDSLFTCRLFNWWGKLVGRYLTAIYLLPAALV